MHTKTLSYHLNTMSTLKTRENIILNLNIKIKRFVAPNFKASDYYLSPCTGSLCYSSRNIVFIYILHDFFQIN